LESSARNLQQRQPTSRYVDQEERCQKQSDDDDDNDDNNIDDGDDDKESSNEVDEVAVSKRGREGTKSVAEDESNDDTKENIDEMKFEVHDFCWKSSSQQNGYLRVSFDDSNVNEKVDLKTVLHDFPEKVICFMWEKYSRLEKARVMWSDVQKVTSYWQVKRKRCSADSKH
jgi:hypothetical protein